VLTVAKESNLDHVKPKIWVRLGLCGVFNIEERGSSSLAMLVYFARISSFSLSHIHPFHCCFTQTAASWASKVAQG